MRVLITGIGGELGTRVAERLEGDDSIEALCGIDLFDPRRPLARTAVHRIDPRNRIRSADVVRRFAPTALLHLGTYEPDARSDPKTAIERTAAGTIAALGAAADAGALDRIVVRSGIEIYGRRRGSAMLPTEEDKPDPTTPWGHSLRHAELIARETGASIGAPVTILRFAPVVGAGFPSPVARVLRAPVVPFNVLGDPPFSLLDADDAADAVVAALAHPYDGAVNVVGDGTLTATSVALHARHLPLPVCGIGWRATRSVARAAGAPIAPHVHELLTKGRLADGSNTEARLAWSPRWSTRDALFRAQRVSDDAEDPVLS